MFKGFGLFGLRVLNTHPHTLRHKHLSQFYGTYICMYAHAHTEAAADFSEIYKLSIIYSPAKLYGKRAVNWQ